MPRVGITFGSPGNRSSSLHQIASRLSRVGDGGIAEVVG